MKTTIDLPDELVRQIREVAKAQGLTMRTLMVEGLRAELARRQQRAPRPDFVFTSVSGQGLRADVAPGDVVAQSYLPAR